MLIRNDHKKDLFMLGTILKVKQFILCLGVEFVFNYVFCIFIFSLDFQDFVEKLKFFGAETAL